MPFLKKVVPHAVVMRNSRKTGRVRTARIASSFVAWRRGTAPFALLSGGGTVSLMPVAGRLFLPLVLAGVTVALAAAQLPLEPKHDSGQSVTAAFEGWYKNPDGSFSILLGYYNRNLKEDLDIPVGPHNRIEPGGPDRGQPTHFVPGRQWGIFSIAVPKDFGDKKLTWTLTVNDSTTEVPVSLNPLWELSPFIDATGNTPPYVGFSENGPFAQGPRSIPAAMTATVSQPLSLTA